MILLSHVNNVVLSRLINLCPSCNIIFENIINGYAECTGVQFTNFIYCKTNLNICI